MEFYVSLYQLTFVLDGLQHGLQQMAGRAFRISPRNAKVEAGDLARFLGGRTLGVVEVGGDGDHGLGDRGPEVALGVPLQLLQDASDISCGE